MLTEKQAKFAAAIADGLGSASAYRVAFNAENMSSTAISVESSRLKRRPSVALRISQLNAEAEAVRQSLLMSREEAILARLEHEALTAKTDSARIRALELLGRQAGLFVERIEVEQVERSVEAIERDIRQRLHRLGLLNED